MSYAGELLHEISRCPNVSPCLESGNRKHACAPIVRSQKVKNLEQFQVPEPWSGHLEQARVLFLSSNPSINKAEEFPRSSWSDQVIREYFNCRFELWIKDANKTLFHGGQRGRAIPFWAEVRKRAVELLGPNVIPGIDYALSEVVHCKSKSEFGVKSAAIQCAKLYLGKVLDTSPARVVVVLGKTAKECVNEELNVPEHGDLCRPMHVCGKERMLVFLPHPNARGVRSLSKRLTSEELAEVRSYLQ